MVKKKSKDDSNQYVNSTFSFNKSSEPVDIAAKKIKSNTKKVNKIIDGNIDGVDDYDLDYEEDIRFNSKSDRNDKDKDKNIEEGVVTLLTNKTLYDKFKNLLKADIAKEVANLSRQLTPNDVLMAKAVSEGMSDDELKEIFKVDISYIDQLKANPNFTIEVQRNTQNSAFGNKNNRIQKLSRLGGMIYEDLISNPEQISFMKPNDKIKLINDLSSNIHKMQDEDNITSNKDITVIIKERRIDENRLIKDESGKMRLKSIFPTLNAKTGVIENESVNIDKIKKI